jgi:hypothetical protein
MVRYEGVYEEGCSRHKLIRGYISAFVMFDCCLFISYINWRGVSNPCTLTNVRNLDFC